MARKGGIWDQVRDIIDSGQVPIITLTAAQEVHTSGKGTLGRPPNHPEEKNFQHYLSNTRHRGRPYCYNKGCRNQLRRDDILVCGEFCRNEVVKEAERVLALMKGWVIKVPEVIKDETPDHS